MSILDVDVRTGRYRNHKLLKTLSSLSHVKLLLIKQISETLMITKQIKVGSIKVISPILQKKKKLLPIPDHEFDNSFHVASTDRRHRQQLSYFALEPNSIPLI